MSMSPTVLMRRALEVASCGLSDDLPIAAIICDSEGSVIASSKNSVIQNKRLTAHAELLVLEGVDSKALRRDGKHMCIAVTLEPCPMCAWAIRSSGIGRLVFGAYNPQYGAAGSVFDFLRDSRLGSSIEVIGGVLQEECSALLDDAFLKIRNNEAW